MGKFLSAIFLGALAIGLSIFTGSRTLDLLAWALPLNQQIYQWLGLCAFEGGMMFWSYYFIQGAKGTPQRSISVLMAVFSIVAVAICTIADLNIDASEQGKIAQLSPSMAQAVIIFLGIVIVANVAAYLACHLLSVDNMRRMKEQEAEDKIYEAGLRAISGLAPTIAADAAPYLATEWANRTWQRIVPGVQHQTYYIPQQSTASAPVSLHQSAPTPTPVQSTQPAKKGWLSKIFPAREAPHDQLWEAQNRAGQSAWAAKQAELEAKSIDTPLQHSEKTSNQIYRRERQARREKSRLIAQNRLEPNPTHEQHIQRRDTRLARLRGPKSIDTPREPTTEKVPALPLAGSQAANSQTQNTPLPGSTGKKQGSRTTATRAK